MGKRSKGHQQSLWVATQDLPRSAGHPFYEALNAELRTAGFDEFVEERCRKFYAEGHGRPSLAPAIYFRMLLVGYFEGIDSERGIAWRCSDSLALRSFLGLELSQAPPDHSTLSRTRRLIDVETHAEVFAFVLQLLSEHGLVRGQTIGVDATTLEANAAMRSLVRRDTGQSYQGFLEDLAESSGVETPTKADLARIDRKRPKKGSNDDWVNPSDPEAQVTKMKDGRTHLAHKAEHAVDLDSGAILGVAIHPGAAGDTATVQDTIFEALLNLVGLKQEGRCEERPTRECVADKGYHSNETLIALESVGMRTYISEPRRGRRKWKGKEEEKLAVYDNRRRMKGARGRRLYRRRSELNERSFAHCLDTGGMRRVHLRGRENIEKRYLLQTAAYNLGLLMRRKIGCGTPRGLKGALRRALEACPRFAHLMRRLLGLVIGQDLGPHPGTPTPCSMIPSCSGGAFTTGC